MSQPTEIPAEFLFNINPGGTVQTVSQGIAESGTIFPAIDGSRFYYGNADDEAIFIMVKPNMNNAGKIGKIYIQKKSSFAMDISVGGAAGEVTRRLGATQNVIKNFLDIYLGCMSVAGGPVAWGITGMNLLVAGGTIKRNYSIYSDALEAIVDNRRALEASMPTFYKHMLNNLIFGRIESDLTGKARELLTGALPGPKVAGKIVGVFLGKIGEDALKQNLVGLKGMIDKILLPVADHMIQNKGELTPKQIRDLTNIHLLPDFKKLSNTSMTEGDSDNIILQTAKNAHTVRPRLAKISAAIAGLTA